MTNDLAPILLFVYNRPENTRRTLEALASNSLADQSTLYIYADGPKTDADQAGLQKIAEVRQVAKERKWCKNVRVIEASKNKGLANSIIDGVTEKINEYGKVIVLEDDLITSVGFLKFMNDALTKFQSEEKVMQVSGHQFPLNIPARQSSFFLPLTTSWGWATWKRAWDQFDPEAKGYETLKTNRSLSRRFDLNGAFSYSKMLMRQMEGGNINSWAIRWYWTVFKANGLGLFPDKSLIQNIGFGHDATHTSQPDPFGNLDFDQCYFITSMPAEFAIDEKHFLELQHLLLFGASKPGVLNKIKKGVIRLKRLAR